MAGPKLLRKFLEEFKRQIVQLYDNGKTPVRDTRRVRHRKLDPTPMSESDLRQRLQLRCGQPHARAGANRRA